MLCDFCRCNEAVHHRMRTSYGFASVCDSCWRHTIGGDNPRSLANFPMQANGAEMFRLACSMVTEAGTVCCPGHDAILIEAATNQIQAAVVQTQAIMREAAKIVLVGFALESDAKIFSEPTCKPRNGLMARYPVKDVASWLDNSVPTQ